MTDEQVQLRLDRALQRRASGDLSGALRVVEPLLKIPAKKASVAAILATIFFELEKWREAADWFATAVALNPGSERASLGLFHSLWELERRKEALLEMARFRAAQPSPAYDRLYSDIS